MTINIKLHHVPGDWVDLYESARSEDEKHFLEINLMFNAMTNQGKFAMLATLIPKTSDLENMEVEKYLDALREAINEDTFN